jgi:ribosomal protein S27E
MSKLKDITGQRFGRLIVLCREGSSTSGIAKWRCRCDCGNERIVYGRNLRNGNTQSCGCLQKERAGKAAAIKNK